MLTDNELSIAKALAHNGKWSSYIETVLNIRKGSLKHRILDSELRQLIIDNTEKYTTANLKLRTLKFYKIKSRNVCKYGTAVSILLKNKGMGSSRISKILNITNGEIGFIVTKMGLDCLLKRNNLIYKGHIIQKRFFEKRTKYLRDFELTHSINLIHDVNSGMIYGELCKKYNITLYNLHTILNKLNLESIVSDNSKKIQVRNSIIASKKGADKVRGTTIIRHPVTDKMKASYQSYVSEKLVDSKARQDFMLSYGTAGPHTWDFLIELYGQLPKNPSKFLPGKLNLMYGKEPSKLAGIGIKGHVYAFGERIHFRSSLELRVYLYLIKYDIKFALSTHKIQYMLNGSLRNYHPDIVIGQCIYEIKPTGLIDHPKNKLKFEALCKYANKFKLSAGYITHETYDISEINLMYIQSQIDRGIIEISDSEYKRLLKNIK